MFGNAYSVRWTLRSRAQNKLLCCLGSKKGCQVSQKLDYGKISRNDFENKGQVVDECLDNNDDKIVSEEARKLF